MAEGNANYLEEMNEDGSGRSKVVPYPISDISGISPGRKWVTGVVPYPEGKSVVPMEMAIPLDGGPPLRVCASYCVAGMVFEWQVPFHCGGSADRDESGAKPGDSGWSGREPGRASSGRSRGRGRTG